jgi:hypothetical protein
MINSTPIITLKIYHRANPGNHIFLEIDSTRGVGRTAPPEKSYVKIDEMTVPIGKGEPTNIKNVR